MILLERDPGADLASGPTSGPGGREPGSTMTRTAGRAVAIVIGLNVAIQVALLIVVVAADLDLATAVRTGLVAGVFFYAIVALATRRWSERLGLRPRIGTEHPLAGMTEGVVVGMGAAVVFSALLRLVFGHPILDPTTAVLAADGGVWLVVGAVVLVVLAPLVEELVFRGFLLEAFRHRGPHTAVIVSAVAFSAAHLRLGQLRYYALMGAAFALLYMRRGLVGSVAAHASFNGTLLLVALVSVHAPARDVSAAGFSVRVPATWTTSRYVVDDDLVLRGPLGTKVELSHLDLPRPLDVDALARDVGRGAFRLPRPVTIDPGSASKIDLPAGRALTMAAQVDGHLGRVTLVPKGPRVWVAVLRSARSDDGAIAAFDAILRSWQLP